MKMTYLVKLTIPLFQRKENYYGAGDTADKLVKTIISGIKCQITLYMSSYVDDNVEIGRELRFGTSATYSLD